MPSHLKPEDPKPPGVSELDIASNALADEYAKEAAKLYQVPLEVSAPCIYNYKLVKRIQKRVACIITCLPERSKFKTVRTPKELGTSLSASIAESRHSVTRLGDRLTCDRCSNSFSCNDKSVVHWLRTECVQLPVDTIRPTLIDNNSLHIGNQNIHHSHVLAVHRGLVYCTKCGSRSGKALVKHLAQECMPPSAHGAATLRAISEDRLPPKLHAWPAPSA